MDIPGKNLGLPGEGEIRVVNLTRLIGSFRDYLSIFPGWHMNKSHWLSVVPEACVADEKIDFPVDMRQELAK